MNRAGFEPAPPKRVDLKSTALDHSANGSFLAEYNYLIKSQNFYCCMYSLWEDPTRICS